MIIDNSYKRIFNIPVNSRMSKKELEKEIKKMIRNYQSSAYFPIDRKKKIEFLLNF